MDPEIGPKPVPRALPQPFRNDLGSRVASGTHLDLISGLFWVTRPHFFEQKLYFRMPLAKILENTNIFGIPEAFRTHLKFSSIHESSLTYSK